MLVFVGWTIFSMNLDGKDKTALKVHAGLLQSKILAWNSFGGFHSGYLDKKCKDQWMRCNWNNFRSISPILTFLLRCWKWNKLKMLLWSVNSILEHMLIPWASDGMDFFLSKILDKWLHHQLDNIWRNNVLTERPSQCFMKKSAMQTSIGVWGSNKRLHIQNIDNPFLLHFHAVYQNS